MVPERRSERPASKVAMVTGLTDVDGLATHGVSRNRQVTTGEAWLAWNGQARSELGWTGEARDWQVWMGQER
jgi:hypothetical protein